MPTLLSGILPALLRQRDFRSLWLSRAMALTGAGMTFVVLPLAVYDMTGSAAAIAASLTGQALAVAALSPLAGYLADRCSRRRLIVAAHLTRVVVLCGLLAVSSASQLWLVVLCATLATAAATLMRPAYAALTPQVVAGADLQQANALNGLVATASGAIAPVVAVAMYGIVGLDGVVISTATSLLVAAALVARLQTDGAYDRERSATAEASRRRAAAVLQAVRADLAEGIGHVRRCETVRTLMAGASLSGFGHGAVVLSLVPFLRDGVHLGEGSYGLALTLMSVSGIAVNMLLAGSFASANPLTVYVRGLPLVGPVLLAISAAAGEPHVAVALLVVYGAVSALGPVAYMTLVQQHTPHELQGRVFSVGDLVTHLFMPAGALVAGLAADSYGPGAALAVAGAAYVAWGVTGLAMLRGRVSLRAWAARPAQLA